MGAAEGDFQAGKIAAVEKVGSDSPAGGTDSATASNHQQYNLSIQLNGNTYLCRADVRADNDLDWAQGKEVPVRVKGKVLELKRQNGQIVRLAILKTEKAH
jgi:hypothetical protein